MKPPKRIWILLLLTIGLYSLTACEPAPDFHYSDGSPARYGDFEGKWMVINYWAEWCKPCIEEIPELNEFARNHADIHVIGVNFDNMPPEKEQAVIQHLKITFPVARAPLHDHFGFKKPNALPTTMIINPDGRIAATLTGPQTIKTLSKAVRRPE